MHSTATKTSPLSSWSGRLLSWATETWRRGWMWTGWEEVVESLFSDSWEKRESREGLYSQLGTGLWMGALVQVPARSLAAMGPGHPARLLWHALETPHFYAFITCQEHLLFCFTGSRNHPFLVHSVDVMLAGVKRFIPLTKVRMRLTVVQV